MRRVGAGRQRTTPTNDANERREGARCIVGAYCRRAPDDLSCSRCARCLDSRCAPYGVLWLQRHRRRHSSRASGYGFLRVRRRCQRRCLRRERLPRWLRVYWGWLRQCHQPLREPGRLFRLLGELQRAFGRGRSCFRVSKCPLRRWLGVCVMQSVDLCGVRVPSAVRLFGDGYRRGTRRGIDGSGQARCGERRPRARRTLGRSL